MPSLPAVLTWHFRRYPLLRARDIYKLIHQGVFGPGHIIASAEQARSALAGELRVLATQCRMQNAKCKMQNGGEEELIEEIEPRGRLVRVNLRPLVATQCKMQSAQCKMQSAGWLVEALVESAHRVKGDPRQMKRRLAAAARWCRKNLPEEVAELEQISDQAEASAYPAFHHSRAYARAYRPAYRVVLSGCRKRRASGRAG